MKQILEIGCGQGFNSYYLSKKSKQKVIGVDLSNLDIEVARKRYSGVDFRVMDVTKLDFQTESFDEVYAMDILEHVDNLEKVLSEASRVLKPGGKFIINVPAEKSEQWLLKIRPSYFEEIHHVRIFKDGELEVFLSSLGFFLRKNLKQGFLAHIELYYLFTRKGKSETQLSIFSWRDSWFSIILHLTLLFFEPTLFKTPLKYFFPIWIITLPIGMVVNFIGNRFFPKSIYYEFIKA